MQFSFEAISPVFSVEFALLLNYCNVDCVFCCNTSVHCNFIVFYPQMLCIKVKLFLYCKIWIMPVFSLKSNDAILCQCTIALICLQLVVSCNCTIVYRVLFLGDILLLVIVTCNFKLAAFIFTTYCMIIFSYHIMLRDDHKCVFACDSSGLFIALIKYVMFLTQKFWYYLHF